MCVCVNSLTSGESICHGGVPTHRPVLFPHLEAALTVCVLVVRRLCVCVCVNSLTSGESICHDWAPTHKPVLFPHLEAALTKIKLLPKNGPPAGVTFIVVAYSSPSSGIAMGPAKHTSQVLALVTHRIFTQSKIHQYILIEESVAQLPTTS
jgi:hypothetical protein